MSDHSAHTQTGLDAPERWSLAYAHRERDEAHPNGQTKLRTLIPVAIERIHDDNRAVRAYSTSQTLVHCVWLNVQDLLTSFVDQAAEFARTKASSHDDLDRLSLIFSRGLLNVLGSFRVLLDHSETALSRTFGQSSAEFREWKGATAHEYDSSFAYRFIYGLRNYCHHLGMPPLAFELGSSASDDAVSIRIDLTRDTLLDERATWKSAFRIELANAAPTLPLMDILDEWSVSFWRISRVLLNIWRKRALPHAESICAYRTAHGLPMSGGEVCAVWIRPNDDAAKGIGIEIVHVDERLARDIQAPPDWLVGVSGGAA